MTTIAIHFFQILFAVLVACIFAFILVSVRKIWPDKTQALGVKVIIWLGLLAAYSNVGYAHDYWRIPPPVAFVIIPAMITVFIVGFRKKNRNLFNRLKPYTPVSVQAFRIIVEIILWGLYRYSVIPKQMTFEGLNYDVLVGLTAIPVALLMYYKKISNKLVIMWNVAGILILTNIVVIAILSTPSPFRVFMNEPANTIVTSFPYIWLPGFLVPFAYLMHIISIRQMIHHAEK